MSGVKVTGKRVSSSLNASRTPVSVPLKHKHLLDRHGVPIPSISDHMGSEGGPGPCSKDRRGVSKEKHPSRPAQSRTDFFDALRKRAAGTGTSSTSVEKPEAGALQKNDSVKEKGVKPEENFEPARTALDSPMACTSKTQEAVFLSATEEEEAEFMRSLGWEESTEERGGGLTDEEISWFYQRLRSMTIPPSLPTAHKHWLKCFELDEENYKCLIRNELF